MGSGDRGAARRAARRANRGARRADRADAAQPAADDEAARQPVALLRRACTRPRPSGRCSTGSRGTRARVMRSRVSPPARVSRPPSANATHRSATWAARRSRADVLDRCDHSRHSRAAAGRRSGADRGGWLRRRDGDRDRRPGRGGSGHAVPALQFQGGAVRGAVPVGLRPRGASDAGGRAADARRGVGHRTA